MKRNLIIMLLIIFFSNCQVNAMEIDYDYDGFPTIIHHESKYWQSRRPKFWCLHIENEDGGFVNLDYRLAGDTLIMGTDYVRVVFGYEEKADLYETDFLLMSAIRPNGKTYADTLYYRQEGDKVYCLQPDEGREILIIDYELEEGDEFTDANGEVYVVRNTTIQGQTNYFQPWYYYNPRKLTLVSQRTGEEDIWIEGIGSKYWGITPKFLMARNKVFTKLGLEPIQAQILMGYGGNLLLTPHVNTENYIAERIEERIFDDKYDSRSLEYEFLGDTLYVRGTRNSEHLAGYSYAECLINDGQIDVLVKSFWSTDEKREKEYIFWARIPGFKAGVYQVGMPGQEYVTLECKGNTSTSVNSINNSSIMKTGIPYDLLGRKISNATPARGIYIEDGKKKVMK